jgi:soluble lytic murein transglycosylase-like protein
MENPTRERIESLIRILAPVEGLPVAESIRQCEAESAFRQYDKNGNVLKSPCGALGLFQLMPDTAEELGIRPERWHENVFGGLKYMGELTKQFDGDYPKALAAYNWGSGYLEKAIQQHGPSWVGFIPPETKAYLFKITGNK